MRLAITFFLVLQVFVCSALRAQVIQTIAGGIGDGGQASSAQLTQPTGVAMDRTGNLYLADAGHNLVRKVSPSGVISTFAGTGQAGYFLADDHNPAKFARLNNPVSLACDTLGNVYISDYGSSRIRKVDAAGIITTYAGGGSGTGYAVATAISLSNPVSILVGRNGNLYITEQGRHRVRMVDRYGFSTVVIGAGTAGFSGDGAAAIVAQLSTPGALGGDKNGNIYVSDLGNKRIRKVDTNNNITTIAGNGSTGYAGDGGQATAAVFNDMEGLTTDTAGNLYVSDYGNNVVRKIDHSGIVSRVAGQFLTGGFAGDGGVDSNARFNGPSGIMFDGSGNYFVADKSNNRIRKISAAHIISTFAGNGFATSNAYSGDGGQAYCALLNRPTAVAVDANQNIFIADNYNRVVRRVNTAGIISTFAGTGGYGRSGDGGPASAATFSSLASVATDRSGNLFICDVSYDNIRKVDSSGIVTLVAGGNHGFGGDGGAATAARLNQPGQIITDKVGNLYILDAGNRRVRKVDTNGVINTIAGTGTAGFFGDGGPATNALINPSGGLAIDDTGNLYISENNRIRKINTAGIIYTIAGNGTSSSTGDGGLCAAATFNNCNGLTFDRFGNLYVYESGVYNIRKIDTAGIINRYAGNNCSGFSGDGGGALLACITSSPGIATDSMGNLLIPDVNNSRIRKVFTARLVVHASHDTICLGSSVTFSANYSNVAGIVPSFHWQRNGLPVGIDSSSWTTTSLNPGDVVTCSLADTSGWPVVAISDPVRVKVLSYSPTISITVSPGTNVCAGKIVTCSALATSGGTAPGYYWMKNGILIPGVVASTFTFTPATGTTISCRLNSNIACRMYDTITSNQLLFTVIDTVRSSVTITVDPGDTVCGNQFVTATATSINASATPVYTWYQNGQTVGGHNPSYSFSPADGDLVNCRMTNSATCALHDTVYSGSHRIGVMQPDRPAVSVSASPGVNTGMGKEVTCTATSTRGGSAPVFDWFRNTVHVNTGATYTFIPAEGDIVYCELTSNDQCLYNSQATSQSLAFTIDSSSINNAGVFPNPNAGTFKIRQSIDGPDGMNVYMAITTMGGKDIYNQTLILHNKLVTADVSFGRILPEGVYMISLVYYTDKKSLYFVVRY